jgi:hypothetical protein
MVFRDSRLKIEWADKHIGSIETRIARLHQSDTSRIDIDPQTGQEMLIHDFSDKSAFDDLALMIGDTVHNLNCALDYTWLQTIEKLLPALVNDRAKFPVYKTIEELQGALTQAGINTSSPKFFRFILNTIRPYMGGDYAIRPIHNFNIRDKHRLLIPVLSEGHIQGMEVENERGERIAGLVYGDFQTPPYFIRIPLGQHVKKNGKLTADIIVEDREAGYFLRVPDTLVAYSHFISCVVESFERFLEKECPQDQNAGPPATPA